MERGEKSGYDLAERWDFEAVYSRNTHYIQRVMNFVLHKSVFPAGFTVEESEIVGMI